MRKQQYTEVKGERIELEGNLQVDESSCPNCKIKMIKYKDNKSLFDGDITFHFIKLKCPQCNKEYLDIKEAEKYDFFLKLRKMGKEKALTTIATEKRATIISSVRNL